jgi:hypothetical protein
MKKVFINLAFEVSKKNLQEKTGIEDLNLKSLALEKE